MSTREKKNLPGRGTNYNEPVGSPFSGAAGEPNLYHKAPQWIEPTKPPKPLMSIRIPTPRKQSPPNPSTSKGAGKHRKHQYPRNKGPPNNLDFDQTIISALDRIENADRHEKPMSQIIREKTFDM